MLFSISPWMELTPQYLASGGTRPAHFWQYAFFFLFLRRAVPSGIRTHDRLALIVTPPNSDPYSGPTSGMRIGKYVIINISPQDPRVGGRQDFQTHQEHFAEASVALRPGACGHRIPCRTQPFGINCHSNIHTQTETNMISRYTELTITG